MSAARLTLRTERLTLRRLTRADVPAVVAGLDDLAVSRWLTVVPHPFRPEDAQAFIDGLDDARRYEGFGIFDGAGLVGGIGIDDTLGYWLDRRHHGKGYMTEAATALVGRYFAETGAAEIAAGYFEGNAASAGVLEKLGFRRDPGQDKRVSSVARGDMVPLLMMRLARVDWQVAHGA